MYVYVGLYRAEKVAPREGAWIETGLTPTPTPPTSVAPREGAWIETVCRVHKPMNAYCRTP